MFRFIVVIILIIIFATTAFAVMRSTAQDGVKLHKQPDVESEILFDYPQYVPVKIVEKGAGWSKVRDWQGLTGWIENDMLSNQDTAVVSKMKVNFRSGPGGKYHVKGKLLKGSVMIILKKYYNWYKVQIVDPPTNEIGWIYRTLVWGY